MVRMVIFVFPAPRCAALIPIWMQLKIIPPIIMRKYTTASLWVSAVEPQKSMIAPAKSTNTMLEMIAAITIKRTAVSRISFAESCFFSPLLRATRAEIATFNAKKRASPNSFGCVVSPTAATA